MTYVGYTREKRYARLATDASGTNASDALEVNVRVYQDGTVKMIGARVFKNAPANSKFVLLYENASHSVSNPDIVVAM